MPKLTKRIVDALQPVAEREVLAWCSETRGFGVRMMPSGVASYLVKYRNAEGRQRKLVLGRTTVMTPDQARGVAQEKLGEVARGGDPSAERSKLRQSLTVSELCDLWIADCEHRVKPNTWATDKSRIAAHVKPLLGARTVLSLTPHDIAKAQADIIAGKTAKSRVGRGGVTTGGKGAAARTIGMLGTILEFAVARRVIKSNPARGVARPPEGRQRRFLSLDEIGRLGKAIAAAEAEGSRSPGLWAVRFLLLSGCRKMEGLGLRTEWIDRKALVIRYPDTKVGAQVRAIGPAALKAALHSAADGWAFPAERERKSARSAKAAPRSHYVGLPKLLARLCKAADLQGVTAHVLRHSYAATAAEMGTSELVIAGLLGHSSGTVTGRYAHIADPALVAAAARVSARIQTALEGGVGADVVQLRQNA